MFYFGFNLHTGSAESTILCKNAVRQLDMQYHSKANFMGYKTRLFKSKTLRYHMATGMSLGINRQLNHFLFYTLDKMRYQNI